MRRKVNFVWELSNKSWRWEASHYEGNGRFFGKVSSPFVPHGEYGSWYYYELKDNPAIQLVKGSKAELNKLVNTDKVKKVMEMQRMLK